MKKSDVKKYASTKHAKLPEKKIDEVYRPKRDAEGNPLPPKPRPPLYRPELDAEGILFHLSQDRLFIDLKETQRKYNST